MLHIFTTAVRKIMSAYFRNLIKMFNVNFQENYGWKNTNSGYY